MVSFIVDEKSDEMSEDLSLGESQKEEQLAAGILAILSPAVEQVDGKIGEVR